MDYSLERERSRINQIISKFTSNYASPVSHIKPSLNKLTRHKKLYSYEYDLVGDSDGNMKSFKVLQESPLIKAQEDLLKKQPSPLHHSSQQIFTFQTIREAIAANPEIVYTKYSESCGPVSKIIQVRVRKPEERYLPTLKTIKQVSPVRQQSDSLGVYSHGYLNSSMNGEGGSKSSQLDDVQANHVYHNSADKKDLNTFNKKLGSFIPAKQPYKKYSVYTKPPTKSKIIHVVLPKYLKNCSLDQKINSSNFSDEETSVKGWEKATPLGTVDPALS